MKTTHCIQIICHTIQQIHYADDIVNIAKFDAILSSTCQCVGTYSYNIVDTTNQELLPNYVAHIILNTIEKTNKICNSLGFAPRNFDLINIHNNEYYFTRLPLRTIDELKNYIYLLSSKIILKNELKYDNVEFITMNGNKIIPI